MLSERVISLCFSVTVMVIAFVVPGTAVGQTPGDPPAGSPPSAVYQLPLEGGRSDAAPRKGGSGKNQKGAGDATDGSDGSETSSLYRTENNFGSSSHVPGSGVSAGNANGQGPGEAGAAVPASAATLEEGGTSLPGSIALLAVIAVAGVAIGVMAVRSARNDS